MECELVFENEYVKIIRIKYGVIINIYKCELGENIGNYIKNTRKQLIKIDDKFYKIKEDIEVKWNNKIYKKDTLLYKLNSCCYYIVGDKLQKENWYWELKSTGDSFSGKTESFKNTFNEIMDIIESE